MTTINTIQVIGAYEAGYAYEEVPQGWVCYDRKDITFFFIALNLKKVECVFFVLKRNKKGMRRSWRAGTVCKTVALLLSQFDSDHSHKYVQLSSGNDRRL